MACNHKRQSKLPPDFDLQAEAKKAMQKGMTPEEFMKNTVNPLIKKEAAKTCDCVVEFELSDGDADFLRLGCAISS